MEPNNQEPTNQSEDNSKTLEKTNKPQPESAPQVKPESETETEPKSEHQSVPQPESKPESEPKSAPQPEPEESKPTPVPQPEPTPQKPAKKPKGLIALVIIFALLAATGIGFGVWGVIIANQKPTTPEESTSQTTDKPAEPTESTEPTTDVTQEIELTDVNIIKDLNEKVVLLTGTAYENDLQSPTIVTKDGTHPEFSLYLNGDYSNAAKIVYTMYALPTSSQVYVTDAMANTFISNLPETEKKGWTVSDLLKNIQGLTFTKKSIDDKYYDLFGTEPSLDGSYNCPKPYYDNSGYYFAVSMCGGTSPLDAYYYKNRYTTDGDHAYVYINAGVLDRQFSKIYCEIVPQGGTDIAPCDTYNGTSFTIDATNHDKFAEYRFVFKKADNGTYYFDKVEKVSA